MYLASFGLELQRLAHLRIDVCLSEPLGWPLSLLLALGPDVLSVLAAFDIDSVLTLP